MRLTAEEKKMRLLRSYVAWVEAKDVPATKKKRAIVAIGRWNHAVKRFFVRGVLTND
jgi:hypothetical protein